VTAHRLAEPARHPLDRPLEAVILERGHAATGLAHRVMVMLAPRDDSLVALPSLADVDPLNQPEVEEKLDRAIHAREPDPTPLGAQLVANLLRRQAAVLAREQADDRLAGPAEAVARVLHRPRDACPPVGAHCFAGAHRRRNMIMILILVIAAQLRIVAAAALLAAVVGISACGGSGSDGGQTIAATTGITADLAERVAGPDADVEQIVPDGASPHDYELSAQDRQKLEEADVVVANGAGLEAGIPLDEVDAPSWMLTEHVGELFPFEEGGDDPHVWMDPTRVADALPSLADALADADPDHAAAYRERAREYATELRDLNREMAQTLDTVPRGDRGLVTSHDSLAYLADRYGYVVAATAFPSTGTEAEASAEQIHAVEVAVRESGVPAIFAQEGDDPETLRLVGEETGVEVEYGLLVESPSSAGSYEEMLRRDADLIADSLRAGRRPAPLARER
jgi:zinc/manganese transport system substrate-binding protein